MNDDWVFFCVLCIKKGKCWFIKKQERSVTEPGALRVVVKMAQGIEVCIPGPTLPSALTLRQQAPLSVPHTHATISSNALASCPLSVLCCWWGSGMLWWWKNPHLLWALITLRRKENGVLPWVAGKQSPGSVRCHFIGKSTSEEQEVWPVNLGSLCAQPQEAAFWEPEVWINSVSGLGKGRQWAYLWLARLLLHRGTFKFALSAGLWETASSEERGM